MVAQIISGLFVLIFAAVFIQPTRPRFIAAAVFVGLTLVHEIFLSDLDGSVYYLSAAVFDSVIVCLLELVKPANKMSLSLQRICFVSWALNAFGFVIWYRYYPPLVYNLSYIVVYAWTLSVLLRREPVTDVGYYIFNCWGAWLRRRDTPRYTRIPKNSEEI